MLVDGYNSPVVELSNDRALVAHKREIKPEEIQPLEAVHDQIVAKLRKQKALELVRSEGAGLAQKSWEALRKEGEWIRKENVSRADQRQDPWVAWAFRVPVGEGVKVAGFEVPQGYLLVALEDVRNPDPASMDAKTLAGLRNFLASRLGQQDYRALVEDLNARAEITRL